MHKGKRAAPIARRGRSANQSIGPVQHAQRTEIHNILRSTGAQAKLTIGQPNDKYEQEADRVSDQVMRMSDADVAQRVEAGRIQPMQIQRMCPECEEEQALQRQAEEEEEILQAKEQQGQTPQVSSGTESRINSLKGGGQPLDPASRAFFEPRFGHDFSNVRVHHGGTATDISRSINARAFTLGNNMVFGSGEYQPQSEKGKGLLGHELTHVVQQKYNQMSSTPSDFRIQRWSGHEHRAMGNMGAILATGDANFKINDFLGKEAYKGAPPRSKFKEIYQGVARSKDPALVGLENQASGKVNVRTNDTVVYDDQTGQELYRSQNSISFGAASEFGGDFSATPDQLAKADSSDNPDGNDFITMAILASTNINHFYPLNNAEYHTHHANALRAAGAGKKREALLDEGFASHFLEDSFAAGHMAPRALDRTSFSGMEEDELGLNRTMNWHDALNAVSDPDGLPTTTRGGFHGDDTMTGNDLTRIAVDVGTSLKEVLDTLANRKPAAANIALPVPDYIAIKAHPKYGKIWYRMMQDYTEDLRYLEQKYNKPLTTDGGTKMAPKDAAAKIRANVFGGANVALTRLGNNDWNGDILVFNLTKGGRPAPAKTVVWVQWFDKDIGYDRDKSGRDTGTLANEKTLGWASLRDTDEKIGGLRKITLTEAGIGAARAADDDTNDAYAVFFADAGATVPIGRSKVQGQRTNRPKKPAKVSGFSWSGKTLSFSVTEDYRPSEGRRVYLRWYNKDSGFDHSSSGNKEQTISDSDSQTGSTKTITVRGGRVTITAYGKANNPKDTYATVYMDSACMIPLGRSPIQPGSWWQ